MDYNVIRVSFGALRKATALPINYKYDIGQILRITGLELPESYVVDFCNDGDSSTISMVGTADGVRIPDEFLQTGKPVKAYIVLSGEDNTQTRYEITIPVNPRPERTDIQPTPEEQSTIDSLIAAMNMAVEESGENADRAEEAVSHYPKIENGNWYVWNPETGEYIDTGIQAEGEDGVGIQSVTLNADYTLTLTFTDGTSYTTPSIRGEPGQPGENGVSPTITVTAITGGHRVEITDAEGTSTFNVMDGETGATPDIQIGTVTTLPAGSDATAEITGTPEQPRLNLGIPEGQQGLPGEVTQAQLDTAMANKADIITDTASGAIASFPDGADGLPLKSLVASIEPQQDLHGYENPWPAGGGKNKFDVDKMVNTADITVSNGIITVTENSRNSTKKLGELADLVVGETYILTATTDGTVPQIYLYGTDANVPWSFGNALTITQAHLNALVFFYGGTGTTSHISNFMIRPSSVTDATFAPYSNECPISGWTGVSGWRRGGNVIDWTYGQSQTISGITSYGVVDDCKAVFSGTATATIGFTLGRKAVKNGETYTITVNGVDSTHAINCRAIRGDLASGGEYISMVKNFNSDGSYTFTCDGTYNIVDFRPTFQSGAVCNNYEMFFAITGGTNPASFEPVNSEAISVTFPTTIFGGSDEVISGNGTSTMGKIVFDGTQSIYATNWQAKENSVAWIYAYSLTNHAFSPYLDDQPNFLADKCPVVTAREVIVGNSPQLLEVGCYISNSIGVIFRTTDMTLTTESAINAYLAENPVTLVYELATPTTFTHAGQSVDTLVGQNNVWVDTGDTTVEYRADTKLYLEKLTAPTEDDMIANSAIASGKYFFVGNRLFLSTASIANGAQLIPGTNCVETNLAEALNALNT